MLDGELARQKRLREMISKEGKLADRLDEKKLFQNYKQLQFIDTLALYFNRVHPSERGTQTFEHVPRNAQEDAAVTIKPRDPGVYALSPFPFAPTDAEFAFAGRPVTPKKELANGHWTDVLKRTPTVWERFRLVPA